MKRLFLVLLIAALVIIGLRLFVYKGKPDRDAGPVQQPLTVSKHSAVFNISAQTMITAYYNLAEGFVQWDTAAVTLHAGELKSALDSLRLSELQKDTVIFETASGVLGNARTELEGLIKDPTLEEKRLAFNSLTQYIYDLLRTVRYDQSKIYFQECPMAFNDSQPGNWLSKTPEVRNPYLGTMHPKYKGGMLGCGGPKDTLNFMVTEPTKH